MNRHTILSFGVVVLMAMGTPGIDFSSSAYAAGGGSMGGGAPVPAAPKKTPQQMAIDAYNQGIRARDKAHGYEKELVVAETETQKAKLRKKITKQYKRAAKRYRSAIKHEPRLYQAHGSLGYALKQLGDYEQAMASYDKALAMKPEYTPAIEYRAEAYLQLARYEEVKEAHSQLKYRDRGHQKELEQAIALWLEENQRSEDNGEFYDWASAIVSGG